MDAHLAEGTHNEVDHRAPHQVTDDDGRASGGDRVGSSVEQTGSDGATQGDELDVSVSQTAVQLLIRFGHAGEFRGGSEKEAAVIEG